MAQELIGAWLRVFPHRAIAWLSSPSDVFDPQSLGNIPQISSSNQDSWDVVISLNREALDEFAARRSVPARFLVTSVPRSLNANVMITVAIQYYFHWENATDLEDLGYDSHPKSRGLGYLLGWGADDLLAEYVHALHSAKHNVARLEQDFEILIAERQSLLHRVREHEQIIGDLHEEIRVLKQTHAQNEEQMGVLQQTNRSLAEHLEHYQQQKELASQDSLQYYEQMQALQRRVDQLQDDLTAIHQSPSWKLLSKMWRVMGAVKGKRRSL
ncbi:hypothetical protein [Sulfobacillus thermosulfidooxidans]|uniref:hypothetical protein n=1 Tax=Sulfobacillus thermosulfidooxidans TaxID=28034 RepID=UPI0006B5FBB3|nr:hypothetical protein [Sulfobacillus thermosulfidooxidans]